MSKRQAIPIAVLVSLMSSCHRQSTRSLDGFNCETGKPGWKRATAVSPDLVPPCNSGSTGTCDSPRLE